MNKDRIAGATENLAGQATAATGRLIGDDHMVERGNAHRISGKIRNIIGSLRDFLGLHRSSRTSHPRKESGMNEDEIAGGLRYVKGRVEKGAGDVTTDTKWQADGVIDQVAGGAQNFFGRAKDKVHDVIEDAPDALAGAAGRARDVAHRGREIANDQVRDNPWVIAAAAGVAGYALAWLLHSRRD